MHLSDWLLGIGVLGLVVAGVLALVLRRLSPPYRPPVRKDRP
jgi:hypothetical protein